METLSPDLIRLIYGHLDDVELAKACMLNPKFSTSICNNAFWRNKIMQEFGFTDSDIVNYKDGNTYWAYYSYLKEQLSYGALQLLYNGARYNRIDLIRIALDRGADIKGGGISIKTPLTIALKKNSIDVYKYLLSHGAIKNKKDFVTEVQNGLDFIETINIQGTINAIIIIYDLLLPVAYEYIKDYKNFWAMARDKLEEFVNDPQSTDRLNDVYNRRIGELRELSQ